MGERDISAWRLVIGALAWWAFLAAHRLLPLRWSGRFFWLLPAAGDWTCWHERRAVPAVRRDVA